MLVKKIKYTSFDGVEYEEEFRFNITKAEIAKLELSYAGGLQGKIQNMIDAKDQVELAKLFNEIIRISYGEKTPDGKSFIKRRNGVDLGELFEQTAAYDVLYWELLSDEKAAADFIKAVLPKEDEVRDKPTIA